MRLKTIQKNAALIWSLRPRTRFLPLCLESLLCSHMNPIAGQKLAMLQPILFLPAHTRSQQQAHCKGPSLGGPIPCEPGRSATWWILPLRQCEKTRGMRRPMGFCRTTLAPFLGFTIFNKKILWNNATRGYGNSKKGGAPSTWKCNTGLSMAVDKTAPPNSRYRSIVVPPPEKEMRSGVRVDDHTFSVSLFHEWRG